MRPLFSATGGLLLVLAVGIFSPPFAARSEGATFIVNSTADTNDGTCNSLNCTLREAINAANAAAGADIISFEVGGTIVLTSTLPQITDAAGLTIGATPRRVTISGNGAVGILEIATGARLTLQGLTLVHGFSTGNGGAIRALGPLAATDCTFSENHAAFGGAIYNSIGSNEWSVTRCTFYQNLATSGGGAIHNGTGNCNIRNSTFVGNTAPNGGALENGSGWSLIVYYSTVSGNEAPSGGSVYNGSGFCALHSTIVANAVSGVNCTGEIYNSGHNLDSGGSCGWSSSNSSMSDTAPMLRPLANYAGPTDTMLPNYFSPAIDAGNPADCPTTDQRGIPRPFGATCDIGAVEFAGEASDLPSIHLLLGG